MRLDHRKINADLKQPSYPLHIFDTVTSTNQVVWDLLAGGNPFPVIVIASQQTAGRGQWGRTWVSSPGGLYLSIGLNINLEAKNAPHLTLLSAWGIAQSLRRYRLPVQLKWPNDLILEGRKLGGIKSETRIHNKMITHSVIGVGINWSNQVPDPGIPLQSYPNPHDIDSLETLSAITINGVFEGYESYLKEGIENLMRNYIDILDSVGRKVMIEGITGTIIGVSTQGELKVSLQSPGSKTTLKLPPGSLSLGYPQGESTP
ncbi:biotin acetyl CoA carboxylase ligase [Crocosphaera subtropica ATCC 51142]|uniref:Biotin acetyl CoA carboxylase ligase n=1 Tax=Crocosphaera subtropica (strain ATCC 51142 / BH68) TaxID=43989 RepID=B1WZH2_CROS5|nr:biotin--[acetyl-CoA-carboxylase] ligase [Crocosphaera subtropica]ACB51124.1 biotin acetyl CoA carboxylase ligase [Crocosphaera subtropica ATCC 51142]